MKNSDYLTVHSHALKLDNKRYEVSACVDGSEEYD